MRNSVDTYYFLGIGGIGMSALARYFAAKGYRVLGYDRTPSALTKQLEQEGIVVQYDDVLDIVRTLDSSSWLFVRQLYRKIPLCMRICVRRVLVF